ncbi:mediator of RNA polymerase II transcription subunit 13-like isoform X1, partial [Lates japonicus]
HLSCSFSFFLHGESNVCTSVEIAQHQPVYHITEHHIRLAQTSVTPVQVILSPYGLSGTLTGQAYKMSDPAVRKLMEDWSYFYPMVLQQKEGSGEKEKEEASQAYDRNCHVAVEVIVGGVRMTYPAAFVLIAHWDLPVEQPPPVPAAQGLNREPNHCSVPLTPPTSPEQPCSADSGFVTSVSSVPTPDSSMGVTSISPKHSGKKLTCQVVHQAWRECYLNQPQHVQNPPSDVTPKKEVPNGVTTWDFNDLGTRVPCSCS